MYRHSQITTGTFGQKEKKNEKSKMRKSFERIAPGAS